MNLVVQVERTETSSLRQHRCVYIITLITGEVIRKGFDKNMWKKFLPGQVKINANAWFQEGELIVGKVIKDV